MQYLGKNYIEKRKMKIYIINRINKEGGESPLPLTNTCGKGYLDKKEAEKAMAKLQEDEIIALNEESQDDEDCKEGYYYGSTFDGWIALFNDNEDPIKFITHYSIEEVTIETNLEILLYNSIAYMQDIAFQDYSKEEFKAKMVNELGMTEAEYDTVMTGG